MIQGLCVALIAVGLVLAGAEPVEAQKKGQSASIQHGVVVKSEKVDLSDNKTTKGAKVGGTIGLISGGSSGYKRRRNAAVLRVTSVVATPPSAPRRARWSDPRPAPSRWA